MSFRIFYDQNGQYARDSVESVFGGEIFTDREEIYGTDGQWGYSVDSALGGSLVYGDHPVLGDRNSFGDSDSFTNGAPGVDDW